MDGPSLHISNQSEATFMWFEEFQRQPLIRIVGGRILGETGTHDAGFNRAQLITKLVALPYVRFGGNPAARYTQLVFLQSLLESLHHKSLRWYKRQGNSISSWKFAHENVGTLTAQILNNGRFFQSCSTVS